jgi:hypothetical protein
VLLGSTQPSTKLITGSPSSGVKRRERETNRGQERWSYKSIPPYVFMVCCIFKHRDNFTFM